MTDVTDVLSLPFDQYQRYRLVADLLGEVRPRGKSWKVLDVGGRTALLRSFLPSDHVFLVDLEPSSATGLVLGDGSRLPYQDKSVDVVAAFDTLEHVPPQLRRAFYAECSRVARRYVILAGPYQSSEVEEAEKLLQQFLKDKLGVEHRYLEEHRHLGLPERADAERAFESAGAAVTSIGHGNLERWLGLMCMAMYMDYTPELRGIAARFYRFYNQNLYASDHGVPVYRHALVAAFAGSPLPSAASFLTAPVAPPGAIARVNELAFELTDFERGRQTWNIERATFLRATAELSRDLEGHRVTMSELSRLRDESEGVVRVLEADLAGHRATRENLERECALLRAANEREHAEHQRVVAALQAEIGAYRKAQSELLADVEGHRRTIAALEADRESADSSARGS